jgi:hypothetical protein
MGTPEIRAGLPDNSGDNEDGAGGGGIKKTETQGMFPFPSEMQLSSTIPGGSASWGMTRPARQTSSRQLY